MMAYLQWLGIIVLTGFVIAILVVLVDAVTKTVKKDYNDKNCTHLEHDQFCSCKTED